MYNPEMVLFGLWSFAVYQGKKDQWSFLHGPFWLTGISKPVHRILDRSGKYRQCCTNQPVAHAQKAIPSLFLSKPAGSR